MANILSSIRDIFGKNLANSEIQKALHHRTNQNLAIVGNNVLNLYISLVIYDSGYFSGKIDEKRQLLFSRNNHREIINSDKEFVDFIIDTDYTSNNQRHIGKIRADNYLEAIVGAIFLEHGLDVVSSFIRDIY